MRVLTAISRKCRIAIWNEFARLFGETRAGDSRSEPVSIARFTEAKAIVAQAAYVAESELDGIAPEIILSMASEPDVMRHLKCGGDMRRWIEIAENT